MWKISFASSKPVGSTSRTPHRRILALAQFRLHIRCATAKDFQKAVDLVRVAAKAGQQKVKLGQYGSPVLTQISPSGVRQVNHGLGIWTHLEEK